MSSRDRNLAMVFSDYLLHPHLDAYDNLAFSALLRNIQPEDEIDELVEEVAELLALTPFLDDRPVRLDDSQRQRVALGRALVRDADGYLFDDPFTAQDPRIRGHVRSVTAQWQRDLGRTSIFTTRTPEEALTLSDQVAVMNLGWVHQVATPQELYDSPADLFVAGFMGNPVMNLVPGKPDGMSIRLPFGSVQISYEMSQRVKDKPVVIVGVRPEHCFDAALPESSTIRDPVRFTARVDDIEYSGKTKQVYLGYEIDPKIEEELTALEDDFEFDLFQNFFVAQLSSASPAEQGSDVSILVPSASLHFFDLETAEAL
jgi:multiple sugar transport system ATP-binding protein